MVIVPVANPDGYYVSVVGRGRGWLLVHLCCFHMQERRLDLGFFFFFSSSSHNKTLLEILFMYCTTIQI